MPPCPKGWFGQPYLLAPEWRGCRPCPPVTVLWVPRTAPLGWSVAGPTRRRTASGPGAPRPPPHAPRSTHLLRSVFLTQLPGYFGKYLYCNQAISSPNSGNSDGMHLMWSVLLTQLLGYIGKTLYCKSAISSPNSGDPDWTHLGCSWRLSHMLAYFFKTLYCNQAIPNIHYWVVVYICPTCKITLTRLHFETKPSPLPILATQDTPDVESISIPHAYLLLRDSLMKPGHLQFQFWQLRPNTSDVESTSVPPATLLLRDFTLKPSHLQSKFWQLRLNTPYVECASDPTARLRLQNSVLYLTISPVPILATQTKHSWCGNTSDVESTPDPPASLLLQDFTLKPSHL